MPSRAEYDGWKEGREMKTPPPTPPRMHFADHRSTGTQTAKLFAILSDYEWHGGMDLTLDLPTTAIATVVSELNASLAMRSEPYEVEWQPRKGEDGKRRSFYRMKQTRPVEGRLW